MERTFSLSKIGINSYTPSSFQRGELNSALLRLNEGEVGVNLTFMCSEPISEEEKLEVLKDLSAQLFTKFNK